MLFAVYLTATAAGCSLIEAVLDLDNAASNFAPVDGNQIDVDLAGEANFLVSDPDVGSVAYVTGYTYDETEPGVAEWGTGKYYAFSAIVPGANVGFEVSNGTANYSGQYRYRVVTDIHEGFIGVYGTKYDKNGTIPLVADFDAGTLKGVAQWLTVDAEIDGRGVSGVVHATFDTDESPRTQKGVLSGYIGAVGMIAAFHGNGDSTVLAGGVVGTAD